MRSVAVRTLALLVIAAASVAGLRAIGAPRVDRAVVAPEDVDPETDGNARVEVLADGAGASIDPPTPSERARAIDAALRVADEGRREVVLVRAYGPAGVTEQIEAAHPCSARRCIDVTVYQYTTDRVLDVFVATDGWRVVRTRTSRGQPPLSDAEQKRAHDIADADADLRAHVGGAPHNHPVLAYPMWRELAPCDVHRCASVLYPLDDMTTTGIGRQATVVVDLSALRVVERIYLRCTPECATGWSA